MQASPQRACAPASCTRRAPRLGPCLVRVVVARARLVAHPDAVVLHGGGVALKDLRKAATGASRRSGGEAQQAQARPGQARPGERATSVEHMCARWPAGRAASRQAAAREPALPVGWQSRPAQLRAPTRAAAAPCLTAGTPAIRCRIPLSSPPSCLLGRAGSLSWHGELGELPPTSRLVGVLHALHTLSLAASS